MGDFPIAVFDHRRGTEDFSDFLWWEKAEGIDKSWATTGRELGIQSVWGKISRMWMIKLAHNGTHDYIWLSCPYFFKTGASTPETQKKSKTYGFEAVRIHRRHHKRCWCVVLGFAKNTWPCAKDGGIKIINRTLTCELSLCCVTNIKECEMGTNDDCVTWHHQPCRSRNVISNPHISFGLIICNVNPDFHSDSLSLSLSIGISRFSFRLMQFN